MAVDKNYMRLGQFHRIVQLWTDKDFFLTSKYEDQITAIIKSGFDINYAVPVDSLLGIREPKFKGYTILHFAAERKENKLIDFLLNNKADITCKNFNSFTPLRMIFELMKDFQIFKYLSVNNVYKTLNQLINAHIEFKIEKNPRCCHGISHFHISCMYNIDVVRFFIRRGVDINETVDINSPLFPGFTPLHFAIRYSKLNIVRVLLSHGANVYYLDGNNMTPLQMLVDYNIEIEDVLNIGNLTETDRRNFKLLSDRNLEQNDRIMDLLIEAIDNSCPNPTDDIGLTFLHASCTKKDHDSVESLLEYNLDIHQTVGFKSPKWPGYTPLHFAARCNLQTVKLLLKKGANLLAKDAKGVTPLDLCLERYEPSDILDILNINVAKSIQFGSTISLADVLSNMNYFSLPSFLSSGIESDAQLSFESVICPGYTLLHLAVLMSRRLIRYDSTYFVLKNQSWDNKPVDCSSPDELVEFCLAKNSDLLFKDVNGMTPLRLAFYLRRSKEFCNSLTEYADKQSWTASEENIAYLSVACAINQPGLVEKYLKNGIDPNWTLPQDETWYYKCASDDPITFKKGSTLLHIATIAEAKKVILKCKELGADVSVVDADGYTPAQLGFLHSVPQEILSELLINSNGNVLDNSIKSNLTHLHIACYAGNKAAALEQMINKYNVNAQIVCDPLDPHAEVLRKYEGYTPLHFAIEFKREELISDLLLNADFSIKNAKNLNSLHMALNNPTNRRRIVRLLAVHATSRDDFEDEYGITPLHLAYFIQSKPMAHRFLCPGHDINAQIKFDSPIYPGDTPHHLLVKKYIIHQKCAVFWTLFEQPGANFDLKNADGFTCITLLKTHDIIHLDHEIFSKDITNFPSSNLANKEGLSYLHICCFKSNLPYVEKFLECGADVNAPIDYFNNTTEGLTPLHIAAKHKNSELIRLLLNYGADSLLEDRCGLTPLHYTTRYREFPKALEETQSILSCCSLVSINLSMRNVFGKSLFESLILRHESADLQWLLNKFNSDQRKFFINDVDHEGLNVLFKVVTPSVYITRDIERKIEILLNAGSKIDHRDRRGRTVLHQAVFSTSSDTVKLLLRLGADINISDEKGLVPWEYIGNTIFRDDLLKIFSKHATLLGEAGLYLNDRNHHLYMEYIRKNPDFRIKKSSVLLGMETEYVVERLPLRQLLTENIVRSFPQLPESKRLAILKVLNSSEVMQKYRKWSGLFRLQRRRMLERVYFVKRAASVLHALTGLPWLCIDVIVEQLPNKDLKTLCKCL